MDNLFINLYEVRQQLKELEKQEKKLKEEAINYMQSKNLTEMEVEGVLYKITPAIAIKYSIDTVIELYHDNIDLLKKFLSPKNAEINKVIGVLPGKEELELTARIEQINRLNIKEIK